MKRKRVWIGVVCFLSVILLSLKVTESIQARSASKAFRQQAIRELSAATTAADAKTWLERNGFDVAMSLGDVVVVSELTIQSSHGQQKFNSVDGYRKVSDYPLLGERWIQLTFLFQTTQVPYVEGAFIGVEVDDNSTPSQAWRNEFARRAADRNASLSSSPQ